MNKELKQKILDVVSNSDYRKGESYYTRYIRQVGTIPDTEETRFFFEVESERTYRTYNVEIIKDKKDNLDGVCTCPQYQSFLSCKHVAAVLYNYGETILNFDPKKQIKKRTLEVLDLFNVGEPTNAKGIVKKELKLEINFEQNYNDSLIIKLRVGERQTYVLKTKLSDFFEAFFNNKGEVYFGKNFTYDPTKHYFNNTDKAILNYIYDCFDHRYPLYYYKLDELNFYKKKDFFKLITNKQFTINDRILINGLKEETPFQPVIKKN